MKKLMFVYTNPNFMTMLYKPVMANEFDNDPNVRVTYSCDNSILLDTLANDTVPTASVETRLNRLITNAVEAGADCVVVGCTAMNLATLKLAGNFNVPVISCDEPEIQAIVKDERKKVAILTHAQDNGDTIARRLNSYGISNDIYVVDGAKGAVGNVEALSACFQSTIDTLKGDYDAIAFGHINAEQINVETTLPIYRQGKYCIEEIRKVI